MSGSQDWTAGVQALLVDECRDCGRRNALRQQHCAHCCSESLTAVAVEGSGRVWSITVVHRGPTREATREGPYGIALIDLAEGARVMTRADIDLAIGIPVRVTLRTINGTPLPYASRVDEPD
ncbi:OB-fold domain-containing protein [Paraburkholderia agricolaris]|uniref:Zn-ribbon domain-containing OB-fold protein n=1 Tax=Paraburkholderia agricolaris TaxID=2152888 RepID=UPI00129126CB|nr:OB-fold domain-containing protein [Paraburkholderia agricolaris]